MGSSLYAYLVYGLDFGGGDDGTHVWGTEDRGKEWADFEAPWYDDSLEEELSNQAMLWLYKSIEDAEPAEYSFQREKIVEERLGVWFEHYGTDESTGCALICHEAASAYYGPEDPVDLRSLTLAEEANHAKISHALEILGVTPKNHPPGWLLLPRYG